MEKKLLCGFVLCMLSSALNQICSDLVVLLEYIVVNRVIVLIIEDTVGFVHFVDVAYLTVRTNAELKFGQGVMDDSA